MMSLSPLARRAFSLSRLHARETIRCASFVTGILTGSGAAQKSGTSPYSPALRDGYFAVRCEFLESCMKSMRYRVGKALLLAAALVAAPLAGHAQTAETE